MDKIYKKYQGHTIENGFSETSPDFKKFASYVKKRMKIAAADRGIVLEDFIVGHYFISGFFRKNEKWAYFSSAKDCWKGFLMRTAKNSKDYTGGTNHYTNLKGFMPLLEQLLG